MTAILQVMPRQVIIMTFVNTIFLSFFLTRLISLEIDTTLAGWCHRYVSVTDRWGVKMAVMVCVCVSHKLHHFHQPALDTLSHSKRYKTQTRELLLTAHLTVYVRHGLFRFRRSRGFTRALAGTAGDVTSTRPNHASRAVNAKTSPSWGPQGELVGVI